MYNTSVCVYVCVCVLLYSADGDYNITMLTKATVTNTGHVTWNPPAVWKSYCDLIVTYFPFDEQLCTLKFGMWTYHGALVSSYVSHNAPVIAHIPHNTLPPYSYVSVFHIQCIVAPRKLCTLSEHKYTANTLTLPLH